ncbi:SusC/RagA family TonB-linked outer membrane protein [Planobacterium oryzisoli]|uniref:TonB-dependent receptor n=1 Tax=Planobacterium oryzisoli TaxID=2771435 RepID=A0A930YX05_9FLAO|nr:TonB-dependent receptor [Planobacterium oryzisoli]MBF5027989.1 TonB-dependent receptor [Planobacterium oryzisoli]
MKSFLYFNPKSTSLKTAVVFLLGSFAFMDGQTTGDSIRTQGIEEVVMIGYGTQKKKDVNSAISSIKSGDIADLKQMNVDQMLQGKMSGVMVTNGSGQPGAAASIRVRGTTSLNGVNEPLYIIDGVPISGDASGRATSGRPIAGNDFSSTGGSGNNAVSPISFLNPNDIESVDVLKDASAVAIYGARGANGVIIITTKTGKRGEGRISYDGSTNITQIPTFLELMNLQQYAAHQNALGALFNTEPRAEFAHPELLGKGTDWQREIFQLGYGQNHQLGFSGGKEGVNYYISGNYMDQSGNIIGTGMKRYTFRVNVDAKVKSWLKVGTNISTGITNERFTINQSFGGLITNTLLQAPDLPIRNLDGTYAAPPAGQNVNYFNPVAEALERDNSLVRKNFLGGLFAEVNLARGLKYRAEISANTEFSEHTDFTPSYDRGSQVNLTADLIERRQNWYSTNIQNLLTYDLSLGQHKFTLLAGQEANDSHWEGIVAEAHGFKTNDIYNLSMSDPESRTVTGYKGSGALYSLFSRLIYDFDSRYSLTASIRRDQSSKFDPAVKGKQVGYFPSVAVSWKLSSEPFFEPLAEVVTLLKLRAGYGETGNQQIPGGRFASNLTQYFLPANIPNPELTWEHMKQTDIGLDLALYRRLNFTVDFYKKLSDNFLFQYPLPDYLTGGPSWIGGLDSPYYNMGQVENKGVEFTLNYHNDKSNTFAWDTTLTFSHNQNKLLDILNGITLTEQANMNGYQPYVVSNTLVGQPIGTYWGFKTAGIFRTLEELTAAPVQFGQSIGTAPGQTYLGDVRYVDINGDGKIDDGDRTIIGDPNPKFNIGLTNNFSYKNFDLSVFLYGVFGNDLMNLTHRNGIQNAMLYQNQFVEAMDYWTPDNTDAALPRPINSSSNRNIEISDRFIEKGDYLRIQNVTLGYTFSPEALEAIRMKKIRLYGTVQNLHTFTDYKGYDPEIGLFNQNPLLNGIDNGRYPTPRTFALGVNLEF